KLQQIEESIENTEKLSSGQKEQIIEELAHNNKTLELHRSLLGKLLRAREESLQELRELEREVATQQFQADKTSVKSDLSTVAGEEATGQVFTDLAISHQATLSDQILLGLQEQG